jgi:hypothetical protein
MFKNIDKQHFIAGAFRERIGVHIHIVNDIDLVGLYPVYANEACDSMLATAKI